MRAVHDDNGDEVQELRLHEDQNDNADRDYNLRLRCCERIRARSSALSKCETELVFVMHFCCVVERVWIWDLGFLE